MPGNQVKKKKRALFDISKTEIKNTEMWKNINHIISYNQICNIQVQIWKM